MINLNFILILYKDKNKLVTILLEIILGDKDCFFKKFKTLYENKSLLIKFKFILHLKMEINLYLKIIL